MCLDLYGELLGNFLFPAFEAVRGRPTVPLLRRLYETERWSPTALRALQTGFLRRLLRHAHSHTAYYKWILDERGLCPDDFTSPDDLAKLPLLERSTARATLAARTASAPPAGVIRKTTSGSSGQPLEVIYNVESRWWRDATRWRGYGWGGYRVGMRALHYWGFVPPNNITRWARTKTTVDHWIKRDLYVDCTPRSDDALADVAARVRDYQPEVIVAYASGAAALARYVNARRLRAWRDIPVLTGAEKLLAADRAEIERAFGPAFETYGCREVMLMASECDARDGLHTSMENLIVEIVVREPDGRVRAARPGERGEVVITDLHNLACPLIRYVNGDVAVAHAEKPCRCGRGLAKIGPIEGRVTDTLHDGAGRPVGGLVFNVLLSAIGHVARSFQVVQRRDRSIIFKVVPYEGSALPRPAEESIREHAARYLPGAPFDIEVVPEIPLGAAGKRRVVVVER